MGIQASATCVMNFDDATGYLVGEPNKGLAAMFTMMNYERLGVGIQGLASAERSYQNAVEYARERLQSRAPTGPQAKDKAADPIIVHPDVRRMLLTMKALIEGGRAFSTYVALQLDSAKYSEDAATRKRSEELVALLTPWPRPSSPTWALSAPFTASRCSAVTDTSANGGRSNWSAMCASPRSTKAPTASRPWT